MELDVFHAVFLDKKVGIERGPDFPKSNFSQFYVLAISLKFDVLSQLNSRKKDF